MIKQNIKPTKRALLFKPQANTNENYSPFEIQDSCSSVGNKEDQSYYLFEQGQDSNPYLMELPSMKPQSPKQESQAPNHIKMNGNHYQRVDDMKTDRSQVIAQCMACNIQQLIPRGSSKFYCYQCQTLCICQQPKKLQEQEQKKENGLKGGKMFICGCCSVKVRYQAGSSQYIRCSKCQTVNLVPQ